MSTIPTSLQNLIEQLARFPGIGKKTAQRLAFYVLKIPRDEAVTIARSIVDVKDKITFCSQCFHIAESDPCAICRDMKRDHSTICVVQDVMDVLAIEKTGQYRGLYHVLGGVLSPLDGIGPEDLHIAELMQRLKNVKELILAINPTRDGETTTLYLLKLLRNREIKITRIAHGLPIGIDLEFADEITLSRALEGRTPLE